jgi:hypothetical protein
MQLSNLSITMLETLTGKCRVPPMAGLAGSLPAVGRKGHNENDISFSGSLALWAGSFKME